MPYLARNFFLIVLCLICDLTKSAAQNQSDTLQAYQSYVLADSLLIANNHKAALIEYEKAAESYLEIGAYEGRIKALNQMSICLSRDQKLRESLQLSEQTVKEGETHFSTDKSFVAMSYYRAGVAAFQLADYTRALNYHLTGLEMRQRLYGENHESVAASYNFLGLSSDYSGDYDTAIDYFEKALSVYKTMHGEGYKLSANVINNIGVVYNHMRDYKKALFYKKKSLAIKIKEYGEVNSNVASSHNNIGLEHYVMGDIDSALISLEKGLKIKRITLGEDNLSTASTYSNLSLLYASIGDFQRAIDNASRAYDIKASVFGVDHINTANAYFILAKAYQGAKKYEKAVDYYNRVLKIEESSNSIRHSSHDTYHNLAEIYIQTKSYDSALYYFGLSEDSFQMPEFGYDNLVFLYRNISATHFAKKDMPKAIDYQRKAADIFHDLKDSTRTEFAEVWNGFSEVYLERKLYDSALYCVQKALTINSNTYNSLLITAHPHLDNYHPRKKSYFMKSLYYKSLILKAKYDDQHHVEDLKLALDNIQVANDFISLLRRSRVRYDDKIALEEFLRDVFQLAIELALEFHEVTSEKKYERMAFEFVERSRGANLLLNITNKAARNYGGIPSNLLSLERSLKVDQSHFQTEINNLKASGSTDSAGLSFFEAALIRTNLKLDSIVDVMENEFPKYYDLKYNLSLLNISEIQQQLESNQTLLEYHDNDSTVFSIAINKNDYTIHQLKKDDNYRESIKSFSDYFSDYGVLESQNEREFFASGHQLYQYLIEPLKQSIPENIDHLIVVPDAQLSLFPWSLFLKEPPIEGRNNYKDQYYLLKDYAVSYAFSSSTLFTEKSSSPTFDSEFSAFAPAYSEQGMTDYLSLLKEGTRGYVSPLKYNDQELESIKANFDGEYYVAGMASESVFKAKAGKSEIVHLAMHALIDHEDPMQSKLIFQDPVDSLEDGMLNTYEIFNMEIPSKLIVLSACETGIGEIRNGEGVMSLGRAFAYAGSPSIVMSQWSVNDQSTADLMAYFYKYLADGENKAQALRKAQLDFLLNGTNDKIFENPYYWGGFVVLGDTQPLNSSQNQWVWYVLGVVLILLGIFLISRKRSKNT